MTHSVRWIALVAALIAPACATSSENPHEIALSAVQCSSAAAWSPPKAYAVGDVVSFNGATYQCLQAHASQPDWTPAAVPALWGQATCGGTGGGGGGGGGTGT